jgi:hypothetical protein
MDTNKTSGEYKAKITFNNGVIFVDETLNEIMKLVWKTKSGVIPDMDFEVPAIDKRMEQSFILADKPIQRKRMAYPNYYKVEREENYNR